LARAGGTTEKATRAAATNALVNELIISGLLSARETGKTAMNR
jgi:hypothetical protein